MFSPPLIHEPEPMKALQQLKIKRDKKKYQKILHELAREFFDYRSTRLTNTKEHEPDIKAKWEELNNEWNIAIN